MIRTAESWSVEALYLLCFIYTDFQNMPGVAFFFFFLRCYGLTLDHCCPTLLFCHKCHTSWPTTNAILVNHESPGSRAAYTTAQAFLLCVSLETGCLDVTDNIALSNILRCEMHCLYNVRSTTLYSHLYWQRCKSLSCILYILCQDASNHSTPKEVNGVVMWCSDFS